MNDKVIKYLKQIGYSNVSTNYYAYIDEWIEYWRGKTDFHTYVDIDRSERKLYSLNMAKTISQDWASILWNEKTEIHSEDSKTDKIIPEIEEEIEINKNFPKMVEKAFYSGTCGIITRVKNIILKDGKITKGENTTVGLVSVTADKIIPLTVEDGKIIDVAFVSEEIQKGKKYYYIEIHIKKLENNEPIYEIQNVYLDENGTEVEREGIIPTLKIKSEYPWFQILTPNIENSIEDNHGLGMSIFGSALDQLKAVDIAYNNFVRDFYLGGKKVFYNKRMVKYVPRTIKTSDGKEQVVEDIIYPDDITKQQFLVIGDEMANANEPDVVHEYNPELRTNENEAGLQSFLNYLSFKCDLGVKRYQFNGGGVVTATEYIGEKQDLIANANKHLKNINEVLRGIFKSLIYVHRVILGENVDEEANINIVNEDGFMTSTEEQKAEFREDISLGLRSKIEYRMKFMGESEEEAKKQIAFINEEDNLTMDSETEEDSENENLDTPIENNLNNQEEDDEIQEEIEETENVE